MAHPNWQAGRFNRKSFQQLGWLALLGITLMVAIAANQIRFIDWFQPLQNVVLNLERSYEQWMTQTTGTQNPVLLLPLAFMGGLVASISPCILALLPVNLSYIGTREIHSRREAFAKASFFVLGVATTLSLLGLFSSWVGYAVMQFRGYIYGAIGIIILLLGLSILEVVRLPLPQTQFKLPIAGPYGFGLTFALVASPCASPVLFAVLAAAAATGSQIQSVLTMVSYSLGYTAVIFLVSLFAGLAKQAQSLLRYSGRILRWGGFALILLGGYYLVSSIRWFILVYTS